MPLTDRPPLRRASVDTSVLAVENGSARKRRDRLAGEEPLEIRAAGPGQIAVRVAVTMRTPGNDFELAAGFLHSEGLLRSPLELAEIKYCTDVELGEQAYNVVTVHLRRPFEAELVQRNFGVTSACGVCGKASIDSIEVASEPLPDGPLVAGDVVAALPERLRTAQRTFERTGGLHATGLFTAGGEVTLVRDGFLTGGTVVVVHGGGIASTYFHLDDIKVAVGDTIKRGALLGKVGLTGRTTGPHIHVGIWLHNSFVDPEVFFRLRIGVPVPPAAK